MRYEEKRKLAVSPTDTLLGRARSAATIPQTEKGEKEKKEIGGRKKRTVTRRKDEEKVT
jgi:hypothetical protein